MLNNHLAVNPTHIFNIFSNLCFEYSRMLCILKFDFHLLLFIVSTKPSTQFCALKTARLWWTEHGDTIQNVHLFDPQLIFAVWHFYTFIRPSSNLHTWKKNSCIIYLYSIPMNIRFLMQSFEISLLLVKRIRMKAWKWCCWFK